MVMGAPLRLPSVIVSVATPPGRMVPGEKALVTVGEVAVTVRVAVFEGAPVAACVLETPEVVLGLAPGVVPRTTTVTVHESDAGTERPVKVRFVWPAVKLFPPAPAQLPPAAPVASIDMPASTSVNAALVGMKAFGFVSVKVIVLVVPRGIDAGANALRIEGEPATDSVAEAAAPGGAWLLVAVLVGVFTVAVAETVCVIVHEPPAGMVPLLKPTVAPPFAPPVSVALPPAEHETLPAAAFESPAGYASEIVTPVSAAGFAAGLETEMGRGAVPPAGIEVGANAFVTAGAANALSVAVAAGPSPASAVGMGPGGVAKPPPGGGVPWHA